MTDIVQDEGTETRVERLFEGGVLYSESNAPFIIDHAHTAVVHPVGEDDRCAARKYGEYEGDEGCLSPVLDDVMGIIHKADVLLHERRFVDNR